MDVKQAHRMLDFLESFIPLVLVPMNPDMYNPEEGCELDVDKIYSLSLQRGDLLSEDQREVSLWVRCELSEDTWWALRQHYVRLHETLKTLNGLRIINYQRSSFGSDKTPYLLIDLAEDEHIQNTF